MLNYTILLENPNCNLSLGVGAKAARLTEMLVSGYPVPKGFVVTPQAFTDFCKYNNLTQMLDKKAYEDLAKAITDSALPPHMASQIEAAVKDIQNDEYAVRSSSVAEDSMEHSMAGQFKTFLNVKKELIAEKIKECWASMFSSTVLEYLQKNNLPLSSQMGVIVQKQIHAQYAGVLFTMDPLTKSTDYIIIEWVRGLGEKLVSGEVTPERIYVNRLSLEIPHDLDMPAHFTASLKELLRYSLMLEKYFHHPVDIEWCVDSTGMFLLQSRPITGLTGENTVAWTNVNMAENFPNAVTPFTWSIIDTFYKYYIRNMFKLFGWNSRKIDKAKYIIDNYTGVQGGRIYYNLSNWYEGAYFLPVGKLLKKLIDSFLGQNVPYTFKPSLFSKKVIQSRCKFIDYLTFSFCMLRIYFIADKHVNSYQREFYKARDQWRSTPYNQLSLDKLIEILDNILEDFVNKYYYNPGIVDILAAIFPGGLKLLSNKWLFMHYDNTDLLSAQLMQGVEVRSTQPTDIIHNIAKIISKSKPLQRLLITKNYIELEKSLDKDVQVLFDEFMYNFGSRCYNDCTIVTPTFEERHDLFWDLVSKYYKALELTDENSKSKEFDVKKVLDKLSFPQKLTFKFFIKNSHRAIKLREQSRIIRSLLLGEIRQITLAMGSNLAEKSIIEDREDVFFLHWSEIKDLAYGKHLYPEILPDIIARRKHALKENDQNPMPSFFIRDKGRYYSNIAKARNNINKSSNIYSGIAVSGGIRKARARIILDPVKDNKLEPGEIIVAQSTDPGWVPLFKLAGGIILERGGMLSHGAIVAREFGIPAIAGIEAAASIIKDGDMLLINGDLGTVEILKEKDIVL